MKVIERAPGYWTLLHDGREVDTPPFATEAEAWSWADDNIDDQVFDSPNGTLRDPLRYRTLQ